MTTLTTITTELPEVLPAADHNDSDFQHVVKNDCFLREVDAVGEWLRSPAVLNEFVLTLKLLKSDLESQLCNYNDTLELGEREPNPEWQVRTRRLKRAVDRRMIEIKTLIAPSTEQIATRTAWNQVKRLRDAITDHQFSLTEAGEDPTEADVALWATLDAPWEAAS